MFEVRGKVLLQSTRLGVSDLLVVLYDVDSVNVLGSPNVTSNPVNLTRGVAVNAGAAAGPNVNLGGTALGTSDRLGSVLTDPDGAFQLAFDKADFADLQGETRPDLLIAVFAPEAPKSSDTYEPIGLNERLLYTNRVPISRAGRNEAFVITLPDERLEAFGVPLPHLSATRQVGGGSAAQALTQGRAFTSRLAKTLRNGVLKDAAKNAEMEERVQTTFQKFSISKMSEEDRESLTYFGGDRPLVPQLSELFTRNLRDAVSRGQTVKLRLLLSETELSEFGMSTTAEGVLSGSANTSFSTLQSYLRRRGTDSVETSVVNRCHAEETAETWLSQLLGDDSTNETRPHPEPPRALAPEGNIYVREMVEHVTKLTEAPETELRYQAAERASLDTIDKNISAFEVKGGPADEVAFHDFYDLRMAFEHVWSELFDSEISRAGQTLYRAWVHLENRFSGVFERDIEMAPESAAELQALTDELDTLYKRLLSLNPPPPAVRRLVPEITAEIWNHLDPEDQAELVALATESAETGTTAGPVVVRGEGERAERARRSLNAAADRARAQGRNEARDSARAILRRAGEGSQSFLEMLADLRRRVLEPYRFDVFSPNSVNFGLLVNYRQKWTPLTYQVGDLVATMPLAPKEVRRYSKKRTVKKKRAEKEIENALRIQKDESSSTMREDAEIVARATNKTNFAANVQGGFNLGVGTLNVGSNFGHEAERQSSNTKKNFREAVLKSAQEYKHERKLELSTESAVDVDVSESGEVSNPNDELTVTYLFYELERQYQLTEKVHRTTPIVMVAADVPKPHEVDESWIIAHEWALRRVILDDALLPAFDYVRDGAAGEQVAIEVKRANWEKQRDLVERLEASIDSQSSVRDELRERLIQTTERKGKVEATSLSRDEQIAADILDPLGVFHSVGEENRAGLIEAEQKAFETRLSHAESALKDSQKRMTGALTSLDSATEQYATAMQEHSNKRVLIDQLRVHLKDNILHYMQALWTHEPPDQRYFRLYNVTVPWMDVARDTSASVAVGPANELAQSRYRILRELGLSDRFPVDVEVTLPRTVPIRPRKLVEVADLDNMLGFKGNYMLFPLKEQHFITDYMQLDFLEHGAEREAVLRDPDELGNLSSEELHELVRCVHENDPERFAEHRAQWKALLTDYLARAAEKPDRVIVPSDQLYIEALPGKHPILEDFKLVHRALDAKKVQAEVRRAEVENIRLAARLLDGDREDPDVDKHVVYEGVSHVAPPTD